VPVYGEDVLSERQCQNWFSKFRTGNFDLKDAPRSGRPIKADDEKIKALVEQTVASNINCLTDNYNLKYCMTLPSVDQKDAHRKDSKTYWWLE
ncbi:hypothetical protein X777_00529, partial [Ooceraea biroi]